MQVSLENTSSLGRRLSVQVPADQVHAGYTERLSKVSQTVRIDGFRQRKVPKTLIEQRLGKQVRQEVISKLIEETLGQALEDHKLRVAGQPNIDELNLDALMEDRAFQKNLEYVASFEVYPVVDVEGLDNLVLEKKSAEITAQDVEDLIEKLRTQMGKWETVERAAKMGDRVVMDYDSTLDGQPYDEGQAKEVSVEIGSNQFIEGFETGLIGKKTGETFTLDLTFPAEWRLESLAGKPVQFTITLKSISEKQPAALDADFAKSVKADSESREDIAKKVRQELEKQLEFKIQDSLREQAIEKALKAKPFDLPQALVLQEKKSLHAELHQQQAQQGGGEHAQSCTHEHDGLAEKAAHRVALGLLLTEIIQKENLKVDGQKVRERIHRIAENFGDQRYIEEMYSRSEKLLQSVQNTVLTEQAIDTLVSKAKIQDSPTTVKELLQW